MILMSPVLSPGQNLVGRTTSCPLWVTPELDFRTLPKHKSYLLFHGEFNALSTFLEVWAVYDKDNFCPLRVTWELSFAESAGDNNSYFLSYNVYNAQQAFSVLSVSSTFCNFLLYEAIPIFSVMSDMRTQLFRKYRRHLIPRVLRWHLYLLYILQVQAVYNARQVFSVVSDMRSQLCRKWWAQLIPPHLP